MNEQDLGQLTLYREDFPASLFPWLESKKEKGTTVTYGRKCSELSESLRRLGSLVRTYLASCELPDERFVRTWSVRDTLSPYLILKLRLSEQSIDGKECSSLPTALWKTPIASDANNREFYRNSRGEPNLSAQVKVAPTGNPPKCEKMWPTPRANKVQPILTEKMGERNKSNLEEAVAASGQIGGQLNPTFVEWLMGFPRDWSEVE